MAPAGQWMRLRVLPPLATLWILNGATLGIGHAPSPTLGPDASPRKPQVSSAKPVDEGTPHHTADARREVLPYRYYCISSTVVGCTVGIITLSIGEPPNLSML